MPDVPQKNDRQQERQQRRDAQDAGGGDERCRPHKECQEMRTIMCTIIITKIKAKGGQIVGHPHRKEDAGNDLQVRSAQRGEQIDGAEDRGGQEEGRVVDRRLDPRLAGLSVRLGWNDADHPSTDAKMCRCSGTAHVGFSRCRSSADREASVDRFAFDFAR